MRELDKLMGKSLSDEQFAAAAHAYATFDAVVRADAKYRADMTELDARIARASTMNLSPDKFARLRGAKQIRNQVVANMAGIV